MAPTVEAGFREAILASDSEFPHHLLLTPEGQAFPKTPLLTTTKPTPTWGREEEGKNLTHRHRRAQHNLYYLTYMYFFLTLFAHFCHAFKMSETKIERLSGGAHGSHTRDIKLGDSCLLIRHTINFSSIFYIQRATLLGKIFLKDKVGYTNPRKWVAWSGCSQPPSLGLAPLGELQGRAGREQPHTLAWKEDQRHRREGRWWERGRGRSQAACMACCLPRQLGAGWPRPPTGTQKLASSTPQAGLAPRSHREGWLGHKRQVPRKTTGMEPPPNPGHRSSPQWPGGKIPQ